MKKLNIVTAALVILTLLVALTGCSQIQPVSTTPSQQEGIWVNGTGKVTVAPDLAFLALGIQAQESTVAVAQSEASKAMDAVISALKAQGIAEKDIQTQQFSIQQVTRYDQQTQKDVVAGYQVTNIVSAKIRALDKAGTLIDAVASAGGDFTRINGLSFSVEDPTQYYDEARTKAVQDAKQTASQLATLNNITLGKPTFVSEGTLSTPPPILQRAELATTPSPETPISPGELEITLTVQIAYEIVK